MSFLNKHESNKLFVVGFLYTGLFLFLISVLTNGRYNRPAYRWTKTYLSQIIILFCIGFVTSVMLATSAKLVLVVTTLILMLIQIAFNRFYFRKNRIFNDNCHMYMIKKSAPDLLEQFFTIIHH